MVSMLDVMVELAGFRMLMLLLGVEISLVLLLVKVTKVYKYLKYDRY